MLMRNQCILKVAPYDFLGSLQIIITLTESALFNLLQSGVEKLPVPMTSQPRLAPFLDQDGRFLCKVSHFSNQLVLSR